MRIRFAFLAILATIFLAACGNGSEGRNAPINPQLPTNGDPQGVYNVSFDYVVPPMPILPPARTASQTLTDGQDLELLQAYGWQVSEIWVGVHYADDWDDGNGSTPFIPPTKFKKEADNAIHVRLNLPPDVECVLVFSAHIDAPVYSPYYPTYEGDVAYAETRVKVGSREKVNVTADFRVYSNPAVLMKIQDNADVFPPNSLVEVVYADTWGNETSRWLLSDAEGNLSGAVYIHTGSFGAAHSIRIPSSGHIWYFPEDYDPIAAAVYGITLYANPQGELTVTPVFGNTDVLYSGITGRILARGYNLYSVFLEPGNYRLAMSKADDSEQPLETVATEVYKYLTQVGPTVGGNLPYDHSFTADTADWYYIKVKADTIGDYHLRLTKDEVVPGDLITSDGVIFYIIDTENYRCAIPFSYAPYEEAIFASWGLTKEMAKVIPYSELTKFPIHSNVTVKPGADVILKVTTQNRMYVVVADAQLQEISSASAEARFGSDYTSKIVGLPDIYMTNYFVIPGVL